MVFGTRCTRVWVAITCSTSEVPMPKASAPKAPWVEVWESPQTMVMPGWVSPAPGRSRGRCPAGLANEAVDGHTEVGGVLLQGHDLRARQRCRRSASRSGCRPSARCGRRWRRSCRGAAACGPVIRRPSNAWGEVTSWTRWRSM